MSLANIRNGLVATIQGAGKWAASEISTCDFGLATLTASCVILQPGPNNTIAPLSYQSTASQRYKQIDWDISGIVMVKDPGDPTLLLSRLWTACDDIYASVNRDDSLNGTATGAHIATISRPGIDAFITDGGVDWGFITFSVRAQEFPV